MESVRTSVLVVSAWPDARTSTHTLRLVVNELARREDVRVEVWFLREKQEQPRWYGSRVVDDLRGWLPARLAELVGLRRVADLLRGLRLRDWHRRLRPDVVLLDDGLGERVLLPRRPIPVLVARRNTVAPDLAEWEPAPELAVAAVVVAPGEVADPEALPPELPSGDLRDWSRFRAMAEPEARRAERERLDLPLDVPLVVGWGGDGWLDGPDVFIRALWALGARHSIEAHGVWFGLGIDRHEVATLQAEAERCGLAERVHVRSAGTAAARASGDAVLLPYRSPGDPEEVLAMLAAGLRVVTFPTNALPEPGVVVVDHLDTDAAAAALAAALVADRTEAVATFAERNDVALWVDRFLGVVRTA